MRPLHLLLDLIGYGLSVLPGLLTWSIHVWIAIELGEQGSLIPFLIVSPLTLALVFISCIALLRLFLPELRQGVFQVGFNRGVLAWYSHLALNRAIKVSGLRYLINIFYFTKYLYFKACGASIRYGLNTPMEYVLVDLPLVTIGSNCSIGENVHISCHVFQGNRLLLKKVSLGDSVFVGMNCVIGPGTKVGSGSRIGFGNILMGDRLPQNSEILDGEWWKGSPRMKERRASRNRSNQANQANLASNEDDWPVKSRSVKLETSP